MPRAVELVVACLGLLLLSPLLIFLGAIVAATSRGPVLFRQQRIGKAGEAFTFYKFRSMVRTASGAPLTASGDARVTPVGKVLRKLKLDELPGLLNVVKGDMALVGPRPEVPRYVDLDDPLWQQVLQRRPGLTDPVTLRLRNEEELLGALEGDPELFYTRQLLPFKLQGNRNYLARRTWRSDLWVLWTTFLGVLFPGRNPPPTLDELTSLDAPSRQSSAAATAGFFGRYLRELQFFLDLAVLACAFALAYLLRYEFQVPVAERSRFLVQLPVVLLLQLSAYFLSGIHSFVWRYISISEVQAFVKAALLSAFPLVLLRLTLEADLQSWRVPLSVIVLDTLIAFGGMLGIRVARRMTYERDHRRKRALAGPQEVVLPVLLVGAGEAGVLATRELQSRGDSPLEIRGFVDDDPRKQGLVIRGVRVLGTTEDLPRLVSSLRIHHVIITIAEASPLELSRILDICRTVPVPVRIIPGLFQILDGTVEMTKDPREVQARSL